MNTRLLITAVMFSGSILDAQAAALTLDQAVQQAVTKYPAVRSLLEQVSAAAAGIQLARTAYLPRTDFTAQVNRATHNNVFGMVLPQVIAPISGPVLGTNSLGSVWGSAIGFLASWEPFDFGLRRANVEVAERGREKASAQVEATRLQVGAAAGDAFLTILAAQETVAAANAAVERARVLTNSVEVLVRNQLRPGADASRSRAELALAETQLVRAEEAVEVGRAALAQLIGGSPQSISVEPGPLLQMPREEVLAGFDAAKHPLAVTQQRAIDLVRAREKAFDRSYFPRFLLQGTAYARGTGIQPNGSTGGAAGGLGPNVQNWGLGFNVTFPVFDIPSIRARKEIERYTERSEAARYDQIVQDLTGQMEQARAQLNGARRVAQNTPIQLEAAKASEQQAAARYRAGLGTIVEVAEAQRILAQAEIDDALARLGIWRGLLALAAAYGDLQPFLQQVK